MKKISVKDYFGNNSPSETMAVQLFLYGYILKIKLPESQTDG